MEKRYRKNWKYYKEEPIVTTISQHFFFFNYFLWLRWDWPPLWSSGHNSCLHNRDILCLLWGTNWIYKCYVEENRPPLWSSSQSFWLHNGDELCFLWATNWIYICYVEERRPPLWSSGQSSWLQIQKFVFDSRRYQIFSEVMGMERGPLSLVSTIEELLGRKGSGSGLEIREYGSRVPSRWPCVTPFPQKLALTSPTKGGRSVGIVRSRTQTTEFVFLSVSLDAVRLGLLGMSATIWPIVPASDGGW
jgi:hypothetical protein